MNGPRDLLTRLLRQYTAGVHTGHQLISRLQHRFLRLYLLIAGAIALLITDLSTVLLRTVIAPAAFVIDQWLLLITQGTLLVLNDAAVVTFSTMETAAVVAIYSLYVWTDVVIQTVQSAMTLPSVELSIEGDVPGGIAVWLLVAFALVTYAFVYRQYPSHQDWVGTVLSLVLSLLTRSLWKSD